MQISEIKIPERTRKAFGDIPALAASIKEVGLLHPVVVNSDNILVAGHRRLKAAEYLGWTEVPTRTVKKLDEALLLLKAERDENTCREDFKPSEMYAMGMRLEALEKPKAKERQAEAGPLEGKGKKSGSGNLPEAVGDTRDLVASGLGVSGKTWEKIKTVVEAVADNHELVAVVEKMDLTGKVDGAFRAISRHKAVQKLVDSPSEKYRVIYADPPWKYGDTRNDLEGTTGAESHYPTMSIKELCDTPVIEWCDENAVLFLWVTSPLLFECAPVIKAWGFQYKACFVWDKISHNMGHYNSVRHEFLLICTRGSCTPDKVELFDSVQSIQRSKEHSQKPKEFRDIIDKLYPHGKRIELFAREKVKGWKTYGNAV